MLTSVHRSRRPAFFLSVIFACAVHGTVVHAQQYRVVPLEPLPGTSQLSVLDLNNNLQAVGTSDGIPVLWDREFQPRRLSISNVSSLVINNAGLIAGIRVLNPTSRFPGPYEVFTIPNGTDYVIWPTPAGASQALELTDSGILLVGTSTAAPSWALYQSRLYNLFHDFRDVSEAGMTGGFVFVSEHPGPVRRVALLRWPDGREAVPWPEEAMVSVVGPHGHFAGEACTTQVLGAPPAPDLCTVLYGSRAGTISRTTFPLARHVQLGDINRAGEMVGTVTVPNTPRNFVFLYRAGVFHDLNTLASIPGQQLSHASRITDQGTILAFTQPVSGSGNSQAVLLLPTEPAPPSGLTFTVTSRLVTLQWQPSVSAVDYIVEAGSGAGRSDLFNGPVGAGTSISAAVPPGRYYVRVRARNAVGVSGPSNQIIIDVP